MPACRRQLLVMMHCTLPLSVCPPLYCADMALQATNCCLSLGRRSFCCTLCVCVCVCVCRDSFGLRQSYLTASLTTVTVQVNVQSSCDLNMYVMAS